MGKVISIKIDSEMDGQKIEYILKEYMDISLTLIRHLKKDKNGILLNGEPAIVIDKVTKGDNLVVNIQGKNTETIIPVNLSLDILWEDEDILVVNKPGDMPIHPSRGHLTDTLANGVMYHIGTNSATHIITRLDRETSGIVLIAKNPWSAYKLSEEMKNRSIKKEYVAILNGVLTPSKDTISAPIRRKEPDSILRCVAEDGKESVTIYEVDKSTNDFSFVKLTAVTGRSHQLRVHMSYVGHPIYGDSMYGAVQTEERTRLHCHKITFLHPETKKEITVIAPIPEDFNGILV